MNKRIKELAVQSAAWEYYEINEGIIGDETPLEKFAELIVRECFEVVIKDHRFNDCKGIIQGAAAVAKEHFGVE